MRLRGDLEVPLPSTQEELFLASQLVYDDAPWIEALSNQKTVYVHERISRLLAVDLGVRPVREKFLQNFSTSLSWSPFGQHENLTQRLKGILEGYPFGEEILKELLQNADDAKASELRIIYDKRNYKRKRVFSEGWAELQGPALCVFNNKPFSNEDLNGIQQLGKGSKQNDASLTGQYGIGFNAVYHITDCPSLLSNAATLCIMDPHRRYMATEQTPGARIDVSNKIWKTFSDVSDSYNSFKHLQLKGGTLFRFPLRTEKMARKSEISDRVVNDAAVKGLLAEFQRSAKDMLLFLRHVRVLTLEVVDERGRVSERQEFKATIRYAPASKQKSVSLDEAIATIKTHRQSMDVVSFHSVSCTMTITENDESPEDWLIYRCLSTSDVSGQHEITEKSKFMMLPVGGVAAPLTRTLKTNESKLFCFLPLPSHSRLPVHINGHFALDPERRGLWADSCTRRMSDKHAWNDVLIRRVIAPAYAQFLVAAAEFVSAWPSRGKMVTCEVLEQRLEWFHSLIPHRVACLGDYWDVLSKEAFSYITQNQLALLPLVGRLLPSELSLVGCRMLRKFDISTLKWLQVRTKPLALNNTAVAYVCYSQPLDSEIKSLLFRLGMPIVATPYDVYERLRDTSDDLDMGIVTPEQVLTFLLNYQAPGSVCKLMLGELPSTSLQSVENVARLLEYVSPLLPTSIVGLPLLVTEDNKLREFSYQQPVYISQFASLFASVPSCFVKQDLVEILIKFKSSRVLKSVTPQDVVKLMKKTQMFASYPLCTVVEWDKAWPTPQWIGSLWQYLAVESRSESSLDELEDWPIIPSQTGQLIPPCLAHTVFYFDVTSQQLYANFVRVLKGLGALEVDLSLIADPNATAKEQLLNRLANPLKPGSLITALCALFKDLTTTVSHQQANLILEYFEHCVSSLEVSTNMCDKLKTLPLFEGVDGTLDTIPVGYEGCCLRDIPSAGCNIWKQRWRCIFLHEKPRLNQLYGALGFNEEVFHKAYVQHILPCFSSMNQDDRLTHLVSIEKKARDLNQQWEVVEALKVTECFDSKDGFPKPTSEFFDPTVPLFAKMLPRVMFPPYPENAVRCDATYRKRWIKFLVRLKLKRSCPLPLFETFAKQMEKEAETLGVLLTSNAEWNEKSKLLVEHLRWSMRANWQNTAFMKRIAAIRFLPQREVSERLCQLAKPLRNHPNGCIATRFSEAIDPGNDNELLCWTVQSLLPDTCVGDDVHVQRELFAALGVKAEPDLVSVLQHCVTLISEAQGAVLPNRSGQENLVETLTQGLRKIYQYFEDLLQFTSFTQLSPAADLRDAAIVASLGNTGECKLIVDALYDEPCVFIEDKQMFVKPRQLVFNLKPQLHPYLLQVPRELVAFSQLFKCLGVDDSPKPFHYARVLESIVDGSTVASLPFAEKVARSAVEGLFRALHEFSTKTGDDSDAQMTSCEVGDIELKSVLSPLYLPSRNQEMFLSSKLVYLDRPSLDKFVTDLPYAFLIDLKSECNLSPLAEDTVDLLSGSLRPTKLSELAREVLDPACTELVNNSADENAQRKYREVLSSLYFAQGVRSIYMHNRKTSKIPHCVERGLDLLRNHLDVACLSEIRTVLETQDGNVLRLPGRVCCAFMQADKTGAKLYLSTDKALAQNGFTLTGSIAQEVERLLEVQLLQFPLMTIVESEILSDIPQLLEKRDIRYVECGDNRELHEIKPRSALVKPGMTVLPEHRVLLQLSPISYRFNVDDWVAYEREEEHFVYAIIVHRDYTEQEGEDNLLLNRYFIDIGDNDLRCVDVLSLYKFQDVACQSTVTDIVVSSDSANRTETARGDASLEEKIREVRSQLRNIWNLPEEAKRKAIRRLYLQWHPDKCDDPDSEEVFKAIRSEIERLEKGNTEDFEGVGRGFFSSNRRTRRRQGRHASSKSYSSSFNKWNTFAKTFEQTHSYTPSFHTSGFGRQTFGGSSFSSQPTSSAATCDKSLGRMFIEQADADLRVAESLFRVTNDGSLYAAVCFHCHEVVEKALKGALFFTVGIRPERQRQHNISYFLHVSDQPGCPRSLVPNARKIREEDYLDTRYPDRNRVVPARTYTRSQAEEAIEGARGVVRDIQQLVGR